MVRLQKVTPYLRLSAEGGPPIFLQGGQAWSETGTDAIPREALPPWFEAALAGLTPQARAEVGWTQPGDPAPERLEEPALPQTPRGARLGRPRGG
jgi:hypothetical protein